MPEYLSIDITVDDSIPPDQLDEAMQAAREFRGIVLEDPHTAYAALLLGRRVLSGEAKSSNELNNPEYRRVVASANLLLARTDNGRYIAFDDNTHGYVSDDPVQRKLTFPVQQHARRHSPEVLAGLRRKAVANSLMLAVRRVVELAPEPDETTAV